MGVGRGLCGNDVRDNMNAHRHFKWQIVYILHVGCVDFVFHFRFVIKIDGNLIFLWYVLGVRKEAQIQFQYKNDIRNKLKAELN